MNMNALSEEKMIESNGGAGAGLAGAGGLLLASNCEPWPQPVEGNVLLDELAGVFRRFVVLPKWSPEALALFTVHTYAFQLRDSCAYIGIESPEKRCGKTTLLTILNELASRAVVAANISSPAWYRVIEELRPTLLIDEADTFLRGNHALRGILNAGCRRQTAFVVRVATERLRGGREEGEEGKRASRPRLASFSSWCPKALAMIGHFPDTIADRCILVRMQRKTPKEEFERLRHLNGLTFKRQCVRFVADHAEAIASAAPAIPEELNDRAADTWEPLLALADIAGVQWPGLAREAAVGLSAAAQEHSPIGALFLDIFLYFAINQVDRVFSRRLVKYLEPFTDRPWAELRKGRKVTELWLSQQFRAYQIRPRTVWVGEEHAKGYLKEDFMDTFRRYIPKAELEALKSELTGEGRPEAQRESSGNVQEVDRAE
jgi:hypothetical protein